jgi:hypothetical protein
VRIKALFIKHTKTGNPLVDSVAEHGSTPSSFYETYLHHVYHYAPLGERVCMSGVWGGCVGVGVVCGGGVGECAGVVRVRVMCVCGDCAGVVCGGGCGECA